MENGFEGRLTDKMSGLGINDDASSINSGDNHCDGLAQVMKAVEAAEATIRHQIEENIRLRSELQDKIVELEKYKTYGSTALNNTSAPDDHFYGAHEVRQPALSVGNPEDSAKRMGNTILRDHAGVVITPESKPNNNVVAIHSHEGIHSVNGKTNGPLEVITGPQVSAENSAFSRASSPSTTCLSPNRHQAEREYDCQFNHHGQGLIQIAEVDGSVGLHKQDLVQKVQEQEQEIIQLKRHLADYTVKEARICNEKYVLDKRIAYMRLAFDQQQQDLVDAASKAISYRQDIMEENIRLSYQLQAAQQERLTFVSSLLPLLAEYSLQPPVLDAQSIVSNVKVLFKHLQEKLNVTEAKLQESHRQIGNWTSDFNPPTLAPLSPANLINMGLELVPQQISRGNVAVSSSAAHATAEWDLLNHRQGTSSDIEPKSLHHDDLGSHSTLASRNATASDMPVTPPQGRVPATLHNEENAKQVTFREPVSNSQFDYPYTEGSHSDRPIPGNRASGNSSYTASVEDPNLSYSPYLPAVMEEPYSSFSDVAEDDPLPAIEGLQISGDAFPGRQLQACGFSINGTTSCNFEWVRHLEDGSVNYIEGAKQPNYLVTADDVDTYLAIEVQPLDDRKRKGELVKVFANEHRKITSEPEMQNCIERTLYSGHASYKISLLLGYLRIWEPGILAIKKEGYSIKCSGPSGVVVTKKFSPSTSVTIPYGDASAFSMICSNGEEHLLRVENGMENISCARDTVVLILRLFIGRACEKRKGKKRGLFYRK
ncbi:hypothetical protein MLD38_016263 [Melastoma candidum]|uniref:Uncharacterized protein n=1 Tax=Melastoma candidum TaxID=119954 RepID=A0ACB9RIG2_9MYRT|nr:hypothetical protein MLD38_016263 [Melastoma candidum]